MEYDEHSPDLSQAEQIDLEKRVEGLNKSFPGISRKDCLEWLKHCRLMLENPSQDNYKPYDGSHRPRKTAAQRPKQGPKAPTPRKTGGKAHQWRGYGLKPTEYYYQPTPGNGMLTGILESDWRTSELRKPGPDPEKPGPTDFQLSFLSLADAKLCGDFGKNTIRSGIHKYTAPPDYERRKSSLSHRIVQNPTSEKTAHPTAKRFAKRLVEHALGYHIPLYAESYHNCSVTIWHLVKQDVLTPMQWKVIEFLGGMAADAMSAEFEFEKLGHFHLTPGNRENESVNWLPSHDMTIEEMHPELMARLAST